MIADVLMNENQLKVYLFGEFEVFFGDLPIVTKETRNSKVIQLLQYFVCNRNKLIPQNDLIDILLQDEESDNPAGTLKNLVYRLRKQLEGAGLSKDSIVYKKNAYGFFCDSPLYIDAETFLELVSMMDSAKDGDLLDICISALEIYRGDFLEKASDKPWVVDYSLKFQEMYFTCLDTAFELAGRLGDFNRIIKYLRVATLLYPYEENLHIMHITCLYKMNHIKDALKAYENVSSLLFNELGVSPSQHLKDLFNTITDGMNEVTESIFDIRKKLSEADYGEGPYFCNLGVFSDVYRFVVRHMERSGKSVFLMLCNMRESDGSMPKSGERMNQIDLCFHDAVNKTCRRGDVYTRYSKTQFLLMLVEINMESCDVVAERLKSCFYKMPKMGKIVLECKCISATDVDQIINDDGDHEPWS